MEERDTTQLDRLKMAQSLIDQATTEIRDGKDPEEALSAALVVLKASIAEPTALTGEVKPPTLAEVQTIRASIMSQLIDQRIAEESSK